MSVIIKGMEMPKCCSDCYLCKNFKCIPLDIDLLGHFPITYWGGRLDNCPLIELPPHGRLIDATFEENHYASMILNPTPDVTGQDKHKARIVIDALQMAKTVIEGSET